MKAAYTRYDLHFRFKARTSRNVMTEKETYLLRLVPDDEDPADPRAPGSIGECAVFRGLGADDSPLYEERLAGLCRAINRGEKYDVGQWSSILFGLECAVKGVERGCGQIIFDSTFTAGRTGLPINGLVWMDTIEHMSEAALKKINDGFTTVKFKIGAYDFDREYDMIDKLRIEYGPERLTIRLDANGAFGSDDAFAKLKRLSLLDIHSVEQPVRAGQPELLAELCQNSPVDIALDEELIGVTSPNDMRRMLKQIRPQYIIIKPSLCGGLSGAQSWVEAAGESGIGWWPTSALESNVGLDAIAQWTAKVQPDVCSGLGTGGLYTDNIPSPLRLIGANLYRDPKETFVTDDLIWNVPQ